MRLYYGGDMALPIVGVLVALLSATTTAQAAGGQTLPAFVWGSGDFINHPADKKGLQASYEVLPASYLVDSVYGPLCSSEEASSGAGINHTALAPDAHTLVSLFVLGSVRREDLARSAEHSTLKQLIKAAPSALYLPNVESMSPSLPEAIVAKSSATLRIGECGANSLAVADFSRELQKSEGPLSGLICEGGKQRLLVDVEAQLRAAGRPFVFVYAGQPNAAGERPSARVLAATAPSSDKILCTGKCMVQVRLFEVLILIVVLLTALGAGLCMLHILDTPSRFEAEKKDNNRHQD